MPLQASEPPQPRGLDGDMLALQAAIEDLMATHGEKYPNGQRYLDELKELQSVAKNNLQRQNLRQQFNALQRTALLANPALEGLQILCVKRNWAEKGIGPGNLVPLGIPSNHECHASLPLSGFDNEIAVFDLADPAATWKTLHRTEDGGWIGHPDLHWNAEKFLFSKSVGGHWNLYESNIDGNRLRKITQTPSDVHCFEPRYLPDGKILCASDATGQCVPCWHGVDRKTVANLFSMNADGSGMRRLTFDQDHNMDPVVLQNGQVLYVRWDYSGINHVFLRMWMMMAPNGTGQRSLYGSNSWFPNGLYAPHELPGRSGEFLSVLSGYHGPGRTGHLVIVDTNKGRHEAEGIVQRISGKGLPLERKIMDNLTQQTWPKFHSSRPITDKQYLVSGWMAANEKSFGIYLADRFDNLVLIHKIDNAALFEPIPIMKRDTPRIIPDQTNSGFDDSVVFLQDVYVGPGLQGVPRGTIKNLRILAYNFGYIGLAGPDKIGISGPWEAMRILGTVPVYEDGSAHFRIPSNTPVAFQALDSEDKAVQLMRSWMSARPGESISCVGCHENHETAPPMTRPMAATRPPRTITPWYGPARGFDFSREVQPVLNRYCVGCHDGTEERLDLRSKEHFPNYRGQLPGWLDFQRMWPEHKILDEGKVRYTPAYETLVPYIRRVSIGDESNMLPPGFYHADTSELIQMLSKGHQGVKLDKESWDRLITWIDLNGPCHGTWREVFPVPFPGAADQRRRELFKLYGGPMDDAEEIVFGNPYDETPVAPTELVRPIVIPRVPNTSQEKSDRLVLDLGEGITIKFARVPAGRFMMGDPNGEPNELPQTNVEIREPFWMSVCEISNEQIQRCFPQHDSGFYTKRHAERSDGKGMELNEPKQPALKVSWNEAMEFCRWLSKKTGKNVTLPTEAQWEYACRAGGTAPMFYGQVDDDFSRYANMADLTFATFGVKGRMTPETFEVDSGADLRLAEGVDVADRRFDDKWCVTAPVGSFAPNPFGLCDMHGNVAEWTLSADRPYPYNDLDGRNLLDSQEKRIVRGGSFLDRPERSRSSIRFGFPPWQRVHNVGFRLVVPAGESE